MKGSCLQNKGTLYQSLHDVLLLFILHDCMCCSSHLQVLVCLGGSEAAVYLVVVVVV